MPFPESVEREIVQTLGQVVSAWQHGLGAMESAVCVAQCTLSKIAIVQLLADLYRPAEIDVWLASPQTLLDDQTPNDLIRDGRANLVMQAIMQLKEWTYT